MGYEKPITDNMKQRANTLYKYMKANGTVTKEEVCRICGVKSERQARDIISVVASIKPVISTSDSKGYRLAVAVQDYDDVSHTAAEIVSRIEELKRRLAPLTAFKEKAELVMQRGSV